MKRLTDEASVHDWNLNSEGPKKARVLGTNCEELIRPEQVGARTDEVRVLNTIDSSEIRRVVNGPVIEEDRALGRSGIVERMGFDGDSVLVRTEIVERMNFDRERTDFDHDRVFGRGEIVQAMDIDRDRVLGRIEMVGRMDVDHDRVLGNVGLSSACGDSTPSESIAAVGSGKGKAILDFDLNVERMDFDLNLAAAEEDGGNGLGFQDYSPVGPVALERVDIIHISSDESDVDDTGKKGCVTVSGGRRYTREEKGKAKLVDSHLWLSLAMNPMQFDLITEGQELLQEHRDGQREENTQVLETEIEQIVREPEPMAEQESRQMICANRYRDVARDNALRFARYNSNQNNYINPLSQETQVQTIEETDKSGDNFVGPFSAALRLIKERNLKSSAEQLINWKPSEGFDRNVVMPLVPSLLDLSLEVLAKNAEAIKSLECVPDALKHRLADMLCDSRKMDVHALDLLVQGSPTEIRVKDCSWLTDEHFTNIFGSFDSKSLKVLQLDLCGQCVYGDSLCRTILQSQNSLPDLAILSLKGACRLTDVALKALVASTPALRSINLGECSLLTDTSISFVAACLGATLRELYIDNCHRIDARIVTHAILEFKHLEVLSVSGIQTVCDQFIVEVIAKCGRNIKGLDLADCVKLTNTSMEVIGNTCSGLCFLNISNLHNLTDLAIQYLSNGCLSIQTLKLRQTSFSDEAIAAFLETSGKSLKELSLNNVRKVGPNTALSLAKSSKELLSLDLSWCRKITNEAVGLIVDSCPSLKLVRLFGCTQISNEFLNGHSKTQVNIIGLNLTPILEHLNMLETEVMTANIQQWMVFQCIPLKCTVNVRSVLGNSTASGFKR